MLGVTAHTVIPGKAAKRGTHGCKMSRRKQSNPQHITKKTDVEIEEVSRSHNVPTDLLHLKAASSETSGHEWAVCSTLALPRGSSFGPYKGRMVGPDQVEETQAKLLQFVNGDDAVMVNIEADSGHWLRLLNTSRQQHTNVTIYLQEGCSVWCEISEDIPEDTELVAALRLEPHHSPVASPGTASIRPSTPASPIHNDLVQQNSDEAPNSEHQLHMQETEQDDSDADAATIAMNKSVLSSPASSKDSLPNFPLIHVCLYCGVKFSSPSTLQAHVAFYCAKKPSPEALASLCNSVVEKSPESTSDRDSICSPSGSVKRKSEEMANEEEGQEQGGSSPRPSSTASCTSQRSPAATFKPLHQVTSISPRAIDHSPASNHSLSPGAAPSSALSSPIAASLSPPPAKAPKMQGLFGCQMCSYTTDKKSSLNRHLRAHEELTASPKVRVPLSELYCHECDIQFTSKSTYQGHKDFYCEARRRNTTGRSSSSTEPGAVSPSSPPSSTSPRSAPQPPPPPMVPVAGSDGATAPVSPQRAALMAQAAVNSLMQHSMSQAAVVMAPVIAPNGMAYSIPTVIMQPILPPSIPTAHSAPASQPPTSTASAPAPTAEGEQPLDLTVKKEEEDRVQGSPSREVKMNSPSPRCMTPRSAGDQTLSPRRGSPARSQPPSPASMVKPSPRMLTPPSQGLLPASLLPSPIVIQPPAPNISKCTDCNIVFYKTENYLAHKEHYCSARRGRVQPNMSDDTRSPAPQTPDTGTKSGSSSPPQALPHPELIEHSFLQYYCLPCKIKFSSMDTLHAHQQFYCPARKAEVESGGSRVDGDEGEPEGYTCSQCKGHYPSARLLKLHLCTVATVPVPLFRCPYCEYIAQSDGRLIEHIKAHAPSKAYKCTICGYRGNTVRGMRMHGKMHIDAGEQFTDEHMREYEEPPLIPKRLKPITDPVDIEGEIMRLKNQPYKRRRSTKMYERMEHIRQQHVTPLQCMECSMVFTDPMQLRMHMQEHIDSKVFKCKSCEYTSDKKANLVWHVKLVHENTGPSATVTSQEDEEKSASVCSTTPSLLGKEPGEVKADGENHNTALVKTEPSSSEQSSTDNETNQKQSVDAKDIHDDIRHETLTAENSVTKIKSEDQISKNTMNESNNEKKGESESNSDTENAGVASTSRNVPLRLQANGSSRPTTPLSPSPVNISQARADMKSGTTLAATMKGELTPEAAILAKKNDKMSPQYCKQCDITFMYVATYVAHKKYYCNSHSAERNSVTEV